MAKKKETTSLIEALLEFQELKSIDRSTLISVLEDSFRNVLSKMAQTIPSPSLSTWIRRATSRSGVPAMSSLMKISSTKCVRYA